VLKPVEFARFYDTIQDVGRYWLGTNLAAGVPGGAHATAGDRGASGRGG
jgi:hypothetical protein